MILTLLVFRLLWGFVGSSTARFSNFVRGPKAVTRYLRSEPAKALASKEQTDAIDAEAKAKRDAIIAAQAAKILADKQRESSAAEAIATTDTNPRIAPVTTPSAFVPGGTSLDGGAHSAGVTVHKREKPKAKK